jgi:ATP-dependent helicase/nuclease subunit A
LPAEDLLAATSMLDWVGPAVVMIGGSDGGGEGSFRVTQHTPEEVATWTGADLKRPTLSPQQQKLARLEPLDPAPAPDDRAAALIASLTAPYPHAVAAQLEAARSVTDWTKQGREAPAGYATASGDRTIEFSRALATPKCLLEKSHLSAADVGTATHLLLQHIDFANPDLALQINALINRKLLTAQQARHIDLGAIEWLLTTDLAQRLRNNATQLRRELDFYLAVSPSEFSPAATSADPADQVMIRGRVDALLVPPAPDGLTLVDYKTDRLTPETVDRRAEFYAPQVQLYRRAMEQITGRPVADVHLVFLTARVVVSR